jgi:hypothetical protein
MKQKTIIKSETSQLTNFFPRVIREFDDGHDEEPMVYWGK